MTVEEIVELIRLLTGEERRRLAQRLRVSGLLPPAVLATDQNRLRVAPALGAKETRPPRRPDPETPAPAQDSTSLPLRMARDAARSENRLPVLGKVVVGAPGKPDIPSDPHAMAPLPGQAPERPIVIIFDGGSKGNPGYGYGSYALRWPGHAQQLVQLQFGDGYTNNEAEYDTLIAALEAVHKRLQASGADPATARLDIRGDSQLVINQVNDAWKCNEERLRTRRDNVRALLRPFGAWQLTHHAREQSVRVLGH